MRNDIQHFFISCSVVFTLFVSLKLPATAITFNPNVPTGPAIQRWGWDLKGRGNMASTPARAAQHYFETSANLVRVPIFVNGHFSDGTVDTDRYAAVVNSLQNILDVKPDVEVFVSVKLEGGNSFVGPASEPNWVTQGTAEWPAGFGLIFGNLAPRPNPEFYSQLVADYFQFFDNHNIPIHYVGLNNETDGALGVPRYIDTVDRLNARLAQKESNGEFSTIDIGNIQYIAPDAFSPVTTRNIIDNITNTEGRPDTFDIVGTHYYPTQVTHTRDIWDDIVDVAGGKPIWHTELHKNPQDDETNIGRMRDGMAVVFDANMKGVDSFAWWNPGGSKANDIDDAIKHHLINSTMGAHPVLSPSFVEKNVNAPLYQAYVRNNEMTLWLANPGDEQIDFSIALAEELIRNDRFSTLYSQYWQGPGNAITSDNHGWLDFSIDEDRQGLVIPILPENSIAMISFELGIFGDLNFNGMLDAGDIDVFIDAWLSTDAGDLNGDGVTDRHDWFLLREAFIEAGLSPIFDHGSLAVPEPTSTILLLLGLSNMLLMRRANWLQRN